MLKGVIIKGIGGFYYVDCGDNTYECRARGKFRLKNMTPLVGDIVEIEIDEKMKQGYVLNILDRKNALIRPTIANVDQVVIVVAAKHPDINMDLFQRFLIYAEHINLKVIVCINKIDLDTDLEYKQVVAMLKSIPYQVIETSTALKIGEEALKDALKDVISVFAGPSGAGKSSLLNMVQPGLKLKIGELSKKIERGTHTTRHAELLRLSSGGMVADTPGFTSLDINNIEAEKLQLCFPEFAAHQNCRFTNCLHDSEPDCGVKVAVAEGMINDIRYQHYTKILNELKSIRRFK